MLARERPLPENHCRVVPPRFCSGCWNLNSRLAGPVGRLLREQVAEGHGEGIGERQEHFRTGPGQTSFEACEIGLGKPSMGGQFGMAHAAVAPSLLQAPSDLPVHDVAPMLLLRSLCG